MNNETLIAFETESELKAFAKTNGFDKGAIDKLVHRWWTLEDEEVIVVYEDDVSMDVEITDTIIIDDNTNF